MNTALYFFDFIIRYIAARHILTGAFFMPKTVDLGI